MSHWPLKLRTQSLARRSRYDKTVDIPLGRFEAVGREYSEECNVKYGYAASGLIAFFMIAAAFCAMPSAKSEADIAVGDFWKYSLSMDDEGMVMTGTFKMEVDSKTTVGSQEAYTVKISGDGDLDMDLEGIVMSGSFDLSGHQTRMVSDFNLIDETVEMEMSVSIMGLSVDGTSGTTTEYDPSMDDYIGDDDMSLASEVTTTVDVTETTWFSLAGFGDTGEETDNYSQTVTMTVVETNVTVTVPAGTFECCKVKVETTVDGYPDSTEYWYYSEEVGYYVKMDASSLGGAGDMELEDYGNKGGGIAGLFSGTNLLIMILIIAVVVVLVAVLTGMRSRRRKALTPMGPPQPGPEIPPPTPGQPPAPPADPGPPGYPPVG